MKYVIALVLVLSGMLVHAQCGLDDIYTIVDLDNDKADTTNVSILVNGAVHNDLAAREQGVCGIKLRFRHPFMKELFIEVISPSGKKVTLTGGDIVPTNTQLITWDVTFVPCGASAAPDFGFTAVWENHQAWQNLTTYRGQYYPHQGCLEDFDTGQVNGVWTIRCIDFSDGGQGVLQDAQIIFCQDDGVFCGPCELAPGTIENPGLSACSGSAVLIFDIEKTFPEGSVDTAIYVYSNVIFHVDTLKAYPENADLTGYAPGNYTICGLQIAKYQASLLPAPGTVFNHQSLSNYFTSMSACAQLSDHCMQVVIEALPEPVSLRKYICKGDKVTIDGVDYARAGIYNIVIEDDPCDSLVTLDLNVIDLNVHIDTERDSIGCAMSSLLLTGNADNQGNGDISYLWFTDDGRISGDIHDKDVTVSSQGTYYLEVTIQSAQYTCKDTSFIVIYEDASFPEILFHGDTVLNCYKDTIVITPEISQPVAMTTWTSGNGASFQHIGNQVKIWQAGKYFIEIITQDGCIGTDSLLIQEDKVIPEVHFDYGSINCIDTVITVMSIPDVAGNYGYLWSGVNPVFREAQNPEIDKGGTYELTMTNIDNGCSVQKSVTISEDKTPPVIDDIRTGILNCEITSVIPRVIPDDDIAGYHWTGIGLNSTAASPMITAPGYYQVAIISSKNFCTQSRTFEVSGDYDAPVIAVTTDSITCLVDSVQLLTISNVDLAGFSWTGPGVSTTTILSPYVHRAGVYRFTGKAFNGCTGTIEIEVINSKYKPEIKIMEDSIRCDRETIELSIDLDVPDRSYKWSGVGLLNNDISNPMVNVPGLYSVTVTNDLTGCTFETDINIGDARIFSKPIISAQALDCVHDSVQVTLGNRDIQSVAYTGVGYYSEDLAPYIHSPGKYYITLTNTHHCVTIDSFEVIRDVEVPQVSAVFNAIQCGRDSVVLNGISNISGTRFIWNGPNGYMKSGQVVYAYRGGSYQVTGIAPNGCQMDYSFELTYDTIRPVFNILLPDTLTCLNPTTTLTTDLNSGQETIVWEPGGSTGSALNVDIPGTYIATVTGLNHCQSKDTVHVVEHKIFPDFEAAASVINCRNLHSVIEVVPTTDYTSIVWDNIRNPEAISNGVLLVNTSLNGMYHFTMSNAEGCTKDGTVEVVADTTPPFIEELFSDTLNCFHPNIDIGVRVTGNVREYLWNGPFVIDSVTMSGILSISESGLYHLVITGDNYCKSNVVFDIVKDDDLPDYQLFSDTITCIKGKVNIGVASPDQGLTFRWQGPFDFDSSQKQPVVFASGVYYVEIIGGNGCIVRDSVFVPEINEKPEIDIADIFYLPCNQGTVELSVSSEMTLYQFNWIYPDGRTVHTETLLASEPGVYRVQAGDKYGCLSEVKIFEVMLDTTIPNVTFTLDTITCKRTTVTLTVQSDTPETGFMWISPAGAYEYSAQFTTSESGTFLLITSNASNCKDTNYVFVPVDTITPDIQIDLQGEILCQKADVVLDASGSNHGNPFSSQWMTTDGIIDQQIAEHAVRVIKAGHYQLSITDLSNGCINTKNIEVEETPSNFTDVDVYVTPPYCDQVVNGTISIKSLNGTPPYTIVFNGVNVDGTLYFDGLRAGNYPLKITDANGCEQSQVVEVPRNESLAIDLEPEILIYFGDSITISPGLQDDIFGEHRLKWYVRDTLICDGCLTLTVQPFNNTVYVIEHTIDGLCKVETSILIRVNRDLNSAVPNIFNPNSQQGNDRFYIPQTRGIRKIKRLLIFDKWAENVYSAYDIESGIKETGWDGTFRNQLCATGVYIIIAEMELSNGKIWIYKGDLTLIR